MMDLGGDEYSAFVADAFNVPDGFMSKKECYRDRDLFIQCTLNSSDRVRFKFNQIAMHLQILPYRDELEPHSYDTTMLLSDFPSRCLMTMFNVSAFACRLPMDVFDSVSVNGRHMQLDHEPPSVHLALTIGAPYGELGHALIRSPDGSTLNCYGIREIVSGEKLSDHKKSNNFKYPGRKYVEYVSNETSQDDNMDGHLRGIRRILFFPDGERIALIPADHISVTLNITKWSTERDGPEVCVRLTIDDEECNITGRRYTDHRFFLIPMAKANLATSARLEALCAATEATGSEIDAATMAATRDSSKAAGGSIEAAALGAAVDQAKSAGDAMDITDTNEVDGVITDTNEVSGVITDTNEVSGVITDTNEVDGVITQASTKAIASSSGQKVTFVFGCQFFTVGVFDTVAQTRKVAVVSVGGAPASDAATGANATDANDYTPVRLPDATLNAGWEAFHALRSDPSLDIIDCYGHAIGATAAAFRIGHPNGRLGTPGNGSAKAAVVTPDNVLTLRSSSGTVMRVDLSRLDTDAEGAIAPEAITCTLDTGVTVSCDGRYSPVSKKLRIDAALSEQENYAWLWVEIDVWRSTDAATHAAIDAAIDAATNAAIDAATNAAIDAPAATGAGAGTGAMDIDYIA